MFHMLSSEAGLGTRPSLPHPLLADSFPQRPGHWIHTMLIMPVASTVLFHSSKTFTDITHFILTPASQQTKLGICFHGHHPCGHRLQGPLCVRHHLYLHTWRVEWNTFAVTLEYSEDRVVICPYSLSFINFLSHIADCGFLDLREGGSPYAML